MKNKPGIIVALDVPNLSDASRLVEELSPHVAAFKVGMELCTAEGVPSVVRFIHDRGGKVFLDLKFKDIPNTVARASAAAAKLGVWMFNVHASGGKEMMEAAAHNSGSSLCIGVTVLTSMSHADCEENYGEITQTKVCRFACNSIYSGLQGIVCSPKEAAAVGTQDFFREGFLRITPGVRPEWAAAGDQKRIATPADALKAGSDYLVIGRPITDPPARVGSPAQAVELINQELEQALQTTS